MVFFLPTKQWVPHVIPSPLSHLSSLSPRPDSGSPCAALAPAPAVSAPACRPGPGRLPAPPWSPPLLRGRVLLGRHGGGGRAAHETAAIIEEGAVVLMPSSRSLKARAGLGVGPHACDDARPVATGELGMEEPGQLQVRAEDGRHGLADGRVGHARGQRAGLDVGGELLPVELQEVDGAEEARREDGAHAEHGVALAKPAGHLCVHALERIGGVLLPEHCGVDEPQLNRSESVALPPAAIGAPRALPPSRRSASPALLRPNQPPK